MAKIFVLEDDRDIREILAWTLEAEDYEVVTFASILDFMNRDTSVFPNLLILDIMLTDGSGLDVCNRLKLEGAYQHIPIIMMSAHASKEQVKMGCRADDFIQKPFELNHFLHTIRSHIGSNPS